MVVEKGLSARAENGIKVRQPLAKIKVNSAIPINTQMQSIIAEEVNVKDVVLTLAKGGSLDVALDTNITGELKNEGISRDFVRIIQEARKKAGFEIENRINTYWHSESKELSAALLTRCDYIGKETLSLEFVNKKADDVEYEQTAKLGDGEVWFGIKRA